LVACRRGLPRLRPVLAAAVACGVAPLPSPQRGRRAGARPSASSPCVGVHASSPTWRARRLQCVCVSWPAPARVARQPRALPTSTAGARVACVCSMLACQLPAPVVVSWPACHACCGRGGATCARAVPGPCWRRHAANARCDVGWDVVSGGLRSPTRPGPQRQRVWGGAPRGSACAWRPRATQRRVRRRWGCSAVHAACVHCRLLSSTSSRGAAVLSQGQL
jgi:hypothetical protein